MVIGWDTLATALGAITMLLLSYFINRQGKHEERRQVQYKEILNKIEAVSTDIGEKLTGKIDNDQCLNFRTACRQYVEGALSTPLAERVAHIEGELKERQETLGEALNNHSHEGLDREAAVIVNHNHPRRTT